VAIILLLLFQTPIEPVQTIGTQAVPRTFDLVKSRSNR